MEQKQKKLSREIIEQLVYDSMISYGWEERTTDKKGITITKHKKKSPDTDDFIVHFKKVVEHLQSVGGIDDQLRTISNDQFLQVPIYLVESIRAERGDQV